MTTATSIARPIGRKLVRALNIFASALLVYAYATFVVLFDKTPLSNSMGKMRLARRTLALRIKGTKKVFITMTVFLFTFDDVVKGCCCKRTGVHFVAPGGDILCVCHLTINNVIVFKTLTDLRLT